MVPSRPDLRPDSYVLLGNYATAVGTLSINGKSITKSQDAISQPRTAVLAALPKFLDKMKQEKYAIPNLKGHPGGEIQE